MVSSIEGKKYKYTGVGKKKQERGLEMPTLYLKKISGKQRLGVRRASELHFIRFSFLKKESNFIKKYNMVFKSISHRKKNVSITIYVFKKSISSTKPLKKVAMPIKVQPRGMASDVHLTVHQLWTSTKNHKNDSQLSGPTQKMPVWKEGM